MGRIINIGGLIGMSALLCTKAPDMQLYARQGYDLIYFIQKINPKVGEFKAKKYAKLIKQLARANDVDYRLVASVIAVESRFNEKAMGKIGEVGLMQLRPNYFGKKEHIIDPAVNIFLGTKYIKQLTKFKSKYINSLYFIEHYNCGPNGNPGKFKYSRKVVRYYNMIGV